MRARIGNRCFQNASSREIPDAMSSHCMCKLKFIRNETDEMVRTIRIRLVLRGFIDAEAFDVETFSGAARGSSQRLLASEAARNSGRVAASMDVDEAFFFQRGAHMSRTCRGKARACARYRFGAITPMCSAMARSG